MVPEIWSVTDRIFCHFGLSFAFLPLPPPNNLKNQNFEKLKKAPGDIILHLCTINNNHMMYGSWDMKCDGQNFLSFGTVSCHFNPDNLKNQNFEKLKKSLEMLSFYSVYHNWQSNDVLFLRYWTQQTYFFAILDNFLPFYLLNNPKYQNLKKN